MSSVIKRRRGAAPPARHPWRLPAGLGLAVASVLTAVSALGHSPAGSLVAGFIFCFAVVTLVVRLASSARHRRSRRERRERR